MHNVDFNWPDLGLDESHAFDDQEERTTPSAVNVRVFDPSTGRGRGGQRPGQTRYLNAQLSGSNPIQSIGHIVVSRAASGATDAGTRTFYKFAVSNGTVASFTTSAFTTATSGSGALATGVSNIYWAELFGVVYFADGTNYKKYTPSTNTVATWSASAGSLPANGSNKPRLIDVWRNRIVLSGIVGDEHNWFMSCVGDATNFDYDPADGSYMTQAVAGNNTIAGNLDDVVNGFMPYDNDTMIFFGDHSVWVLQGDPAQGGGFNRVTDTVGAAWGKAFCRDAAGNIYFFGSRGGVYRMAPGGKPEKITANSIDYRLGQINLSTHRVNMAWNEAEIGLHVWITPLTAGATTHYFWDARNGGWWPDVYATAAHNPVSVHTFDGDAPGDRTILLGGSDGRIRYLNASSADDDDAAIDSSIYLRPRRRSKMEATILCELQGTMGTGSNNVTGTVYAGDAVQSAFASSTARWSGTFAANRNYAKRMRIYGDAHWLKLRNSTISQTWSFESMRGRMESTGDTRQRSRR